MLGRDRVPPVDLGELRCQGQVGNAKSPATQVEEEIR